MPFNQSKKDIKEIKNYSKGDFINVSEINSICKFICKSEY